MIKITKAGSDRIQREAYVISSSIPIRMLPRPAAGLPIALAQA
ncbi:MAG: hypothetical protein ABI868_19085 [Acidobacteriota bacterium]